MIHFLYNPIADNGTCERFAREYAKEHLTQEECVFTNITLLHDPYGFIERHAQEQRMVIAGGDGTLNALINSVGSRRFTRPLYFFSCGTGNDLPRDLGIPARKEFLRVNELIEHLPKITVDGMTRRFFNGVGFGLDGYCCAELERQKKAGKEKVSYIAIAARGLAYAYKPCNAVATVDGRTLELEKVWLAPTMKGRYFGGGFMIAPGQDRNAEDRHVTVILAHSVGRLKALFLLLKARKGKHVNDTNHIIVLEGHEVSITFDRPAAMQIDGEVLEHVTSYEVRAE